VRQNRIAEQSAGLRPRHAKYHRQARAAPLPNLATAINPISDGCIPSSDGVIDAPVVVAHQSTTPSVDNPISRLSTTRSALGQAR
jgi:hypothetical protein